MAGWNLSKGELSKEEFNEEKLWALFNFVFSESCSKRNTYKFGFIKSILDNLFNATISLEGTFFISYEQLFSKFAENYWNLVVKYKLRQMRKDGKTEISKIEQILNKVIEENNILAYMEFSSLDKELKEKIVKESSKECRRNVVGALYEDMEGFFYEFDLKGKGIFIHPISYEFVLKHKYVLEKLNYYSWAKFLEKINDEEVLIKVIEKLELATPKRTDLSIYREILYDEFEENNCFYCGKKLQKGIHVDHFIPWTFVKDDKLWNFVLACPSCNIKKSNKLPSRQALERLQQRNNLKLSNYKTEIVISDFLNYSDELLSRMWKYAKLCGMKEFL